ncbi:alpha/beta hydrolase [Rathayibacter toxicus]|uniref:Alpha/beta hydrolase n=1 Tax=Rathayibacter toxicus TaxID=145458 RepID=A0A0U1PRD9_9MICO|nr:alpha/beta hydrolase [Rathayibacter toxicus]ALS56499.1 alpha/beta hydrolase [Rathayibacter toxicus]KKM44601.1 alpha/beta hydrolase [Rathayibacter toxicus]PPG21678.1 alpha/beta hydrolase [Rathayibacter toxicus]PPG46640.1 alpha/beta hydrolase [Rathayibacter toxicus]PPH23720.1 alpha/beta hydrolase [Rathayibacter toxicus]
MTSEIRGAVRLPARREDIELRTSDGLTLVGELALPREREPVATLVTLHPLPTHGGFMDSHILRKVAARLPALADLAVLRFNTRGTSSPRGTSEGEFDHGEAERADVAAAMQLVTDRDLPHPWLLGWSFGTELALKWGLAHPIDGAILLSPPLHRTTAADVAAWGEDGRALIAVIPEFDDYLRPAEAAQRFATVPQLELVAVEDGTHLWVGERQTRRVLDIIAGVVAPSATPLPTEWVGELG